MLGLKGKKELKGRCKGPRKLKCGGSRKKNMIPEIYTNRVLTSWGKEAGRAKRVRAGKRRVEMGRESLKEEISPPSRKG